MGREIVALIELDEDTVIRNCEANGVSDDGDIDYLIKEFGWLEQSGIKLKDAFIADEDDEIAFGRYIHYLVHWAFEHCADEETTASPLSFRLFQKDK